MSLQESSHGLVQVITLLWIRYTMAILGINHEIKGFIGHLECVYQLESVAHMNVVIALSPVSI